MVVDGQNGCKDWLQNCEIRRCQWTNLWDSHNRIWRITDRRIREQQQQQQIRMSGTIDLINHNEIENRIINYLVSDGGWRSKRVQRSIAKLQNLKVSTDEFMGQPQQSLTDNGQTNMQTTATTTDSNEWNNQFNKSQWNKQYNDVTYLLIDRGGW